MEAQIKAEALFLQLMEMCSGRLSIGAHTEWLAGLHPQCWELHCNLYASRWG